VSLNTSSVHVQIETQRMSKWHK